MFKFNLKGLTPIEKDEIVTKAKAMRELKGSWAFKVFLNEVTEIKDRAINELSEIKDDHRFFQGAIIAYKAVLDITSRLISEEEQLNRQSEEEKITEAKQNQNFISRWINIGNDSVVR